MTEDEKNISQRRDEVIKKMLSTPPKPHKPLKKKKPAKKKASKKSPSS